MTGTDESLRNVNEIARDRHSFENRRAAGLDGKTESPEGRRSRSKTTRVLRRFEKTFRFEMKYARKLENNRDKKRERTRDHTWREETHDIEEDDDDQDEKDQDTWHRNKIAIEMKFDIIQDSRSQRTDEKIKLSSTNKTC